MPHPFALTLLRWFRENGRELPWRGTTDPYAIWLSEIILQQTQVRQGWAYWEQFMRRWPTVEALAAASEDEVMRQWQGLGYYSRARNLHHAARQVVQMGGFPRTVEGLKALKGVGDYTAAAIGSIAFGLPAAVVDGNVYRVLSRYFGVSTPINTTQGKREFTALAQSLLPQGEASAFNQAMMDFGATQCTPQSPRCAQCPLLSSCEAFRQGRVAQLPVKERRLQVKERRFAYIYIRCQGQVALRRRGQGDIWQALWEPFLMENAQPEDYPWLPVQQLMLLRQGVRHVLTHRVLLVDFYYLPLSSRPELPSDYVWVDEQQLDHYGVPRLVELLFQMVPR